MRPARLVVGFGDFSKDLENGKGVLSVWDAASAEGRFKHKTLIDIKQAPFCYHLNRTLDILVIGMNGLIQTLDSTDFSTKAIISVAALVNCITSAAQADTKVIVGMANGHICLLDCETYSIDRQIVLEIPTRLLFGDKATIYNIRHNAAKEVYLLATDNGLVKLGDIDLGLVSHSFEGQTIRGIEVLQSGEKTRYLIYDRDNKLIVFDEDIGENLQEIQKKDGWALIKSLSMVDGSDRHFILRDEDELWFLNFHDQKTFEFSLTRIATIRYESTVCLAPQCFDYQSKYKINA